MQKSAAIAFVPLNFVRVLWNNLKAGMPDNEKLERYTAYFDKTWFEGHLRPCIWITTDTVAQGQTTIWKGSTTG